MFLGSDFSWISLILYIDVLEVIMGPTSIYGIHEIPMSPPT